MRSIRVALAVALAAFGPAGPAVAVADEAAGGERATLWERAARDERDRAYLAAMAEGDGFALRAADIALEAQQQQADREHRAAGQTVALMAAAAYERAAAVRPTAAESHLRAAEVLYGHFVAPLKPDERPQEAPTRRAIAHWESFERLAPRDPRLAPRLGETLYFRRSMAYTKLGGEENFRLGIRDYERLLRLTDPASVPAGLLVTSIANAAELRMAVGEIDRAITGYREALALHDSALHGFGLAVALDRDGQRVKAREVMRSALGSDRGMSELFGPSVFFVPEGEIHYYLALGQEVLGNAPSAANHYRQFLRALPGSRWAERARANLAELERRPPAVGAAAGRARGRAGR